MLGDIGMGNKKKKNRSNSVLADFEIVKLACEFVNNNKFLPWTDFSSQINKIEAGSNIIR